MRNLKKLLAVVVAICVLATMTIPAFAAETKTDAQIVEALGVLKGDGAGVTDTYLAKGTNRMQAAQLYLRLIGLEDEALAELSTDNFDDADLVYAGGQRILAYLKANPDLGWNGVGGNKFEPTGAASAQMIYKVMLEAMGYKQGVDFEWADVLTFAADKGLSKIADVTNLTNNDMATALVEALNAKVKDSDTTLAAKLVADGVIDEAAAAEAGLITLTPATLEVVSVTAENQKEVIVVFNKAVDGDTVKAENIKVDGKTATVSLNDDKVTVVVKLSEATLLDNQSEYKLIVEGVKDTDGKEIAKVEKTFKVFDATLPVAEKVTVTGPKNFTITFSEPIKLGGEVEIKSGTSVIGVNSTFTGYEGRDIKVELYSSLTDGKTYEVTVKGFEDYAGYKNIVKTFELAYAKDASAPTATVEKIDQKYVKIKFNKPVTGLIKEQFYHTFTAWTALGIYKNEAMDDAISSTDSVDTVWVKFADSASDKPIGEGKTIIGIRGKADDSGGTSYEIKDNWDNKFESATIEITVSADKIAPEVSELTVDTESTLKIKFSEDVAFGNDNVEIFDTDGKTIDGVSVSVSGSGKEYTIDLNKNLAGKTIVVKIKDVEDKALQPNKMSVYTNNISITDKSAPEVSKVTIKDSEKALYVFFNEAVDGTAVEKANYAFIKDGKLKLIEKDPAFYDGNKVVKIALKDEEYTAFASQDGLFVQRVKDLAGNAMAGQTIAKGSILAHDNVDNMPKVTKIEVTATDKVAVTFDQYLKRVDRGAFAVNGTTAAAMELSTNDDGNTVVTLIPASTAKFAANIAGATLTVAVGDTYKILNIFDVSAVSDSFTTATAVKLVDKIAPEITKTDDKYNIEAVAGSNVIAVKFSEPIEAAALSRLTFEVKDRTVASVGLKSGDSTVVEITVTGDNFATGAKLNVTQKFAVVDMSGNEYKLADTVTVTVVAAP